jgi:ankyrin repeat protein
VLSTLDPGSVQNLINFAPGGANTLLFKACENGHKEVVTFLLEKGSDGRIHAVTKYSPLYVAAFNGRRDIVEVLLKKFPNLINVLTVERWSPLHAACINGHLPVLDFLLRFTYPKECLKKLRDRKGTKEYNVPFDINLRDVNGQTVLYLACCLGNLKIVELLLKYQVKARKIAPSTLLRKKKLPGIVCLFVCLFVCLWVCGDGVV